MAERTEAPKFSDWRAKDHGTVEANRFSIRLEGYVPKGAAEFIAAAPDVLAALRSNGVHDATCLSYDRDNPRAGWDESIDPKICSCPLATLSLTRGER